MVDNPVVLLILAALVILAIVVFRINKNAFIGHFGERKLIKKLCIIPNSYLINNVTFYSQNEKSVQIDHVLVSSRGIFVIETKSYSGRIYGNNSNLEWTQVLNFGSVKNRFYSPVKQNNTHIYELGKKLDKPMFNCVVFVRGDISKVESKNVFDLTSIYKFVMAKPEIYTMEEIEEYKNIISGLCVKISNKEHINNINRMKKNISNNICPRCNKELLLRIGSKGSFYGCSNYPKCTFKKKVK